MDKYILDIKGAAAILGVSTFTVYRLVAKNILPATKVGKQYRRALPHRNAILQWIASDCKTNQLESLLKSVHVRKK